MPFNEKFNVYCDAANDDYAGEWNFFYDDAFAIIVFPSLILSTGLILCSAMHCNKHFCVLCLLNFHKIALHYAKKLVMHCIRLYRIPKLVYCNATQLPSTAVPLQCRVDG